ncbi:MAG: hypothetical protein IJW60_06055 [Clostridia bacterium]|nr:hypothetical protein [Clostridia bacterium]
MAKRILRAIMLTVMSLALLLSLACCKDEDESSLQSSIDSSTETASISAETLQLVLGDMETLTVAGAQGNVVWTTRNPSVATVENGTVTATGRGETWIVATFSNGELYCRVTVEIESVALPTIKLVGEIKTQSGYALNVLVGEKYALNPVFSIGEQEPTVTFGLTASAGIVVDGLSFTATEPIENGKVTVSCTYGGETYTLEVAVSASAEV